MAKGWKRFVGVFLAPVLALVSVGGGAFTVQAYPGLELVVGSTTYEINWDDWNLAGRLPVGLPAPETHAGQDRLGAYRETAWGTAYAIRLYDAQPVVLFTRTLADATAGQAGESAARARFPVFHRYPKSLRGVSFERHEFSPIHFDLDHEAPWVLHDADARAMMMSPADHFMVANNFHDADGSIGVRIEPQVTETAPALSFRSILVFERGINRAFETWGAALTTLHGKTRPANDADLSLEKLGYWTDNRSAYWYNHSQKLGYEGTLLAVREEFARAEIPLAYFQLDSWWYVKGGDPTAQPALPPSWKKSNYEHGIYLYAAAAELFPHGLADFHDRLGLPFVTHARWIDPTSPYMQRYAMSGMAPIDPAYWEDVMGRLAAEGVFVYEQDWLNERALPRLDRLHDGDLFMDGMAQAAARHGVHLQYCMALPRHFLQSVNYDNLTSIRASGDGFERAKWTQFLFVSRLASSLGIWPWADVFLSGDRENAVLATLSAGVVGVGDHLSAEAIAGDYDPRACADGHCTLLKAENLRSIIRADGVIVKPDTTLVPDDRSFMEQSDPAVTLKPILASAKTLEGDRTLAAYVYAYAPMGSDGADVEIDPAKLGITGEAYVYRYFEGRGEAVNAGHTLKVRVPVMGSYFVVVPVTDGLATLGDLDQFVSLGRKRLRSLSPQIWELVLAPGENSRQLTIYSARGEPSVSVEGGVIASTAYETTTGLARVGIGGGLRVRVHVRPPATL